MNHLIFFSVDFFPLLASLLSAWTCTLLGNFLVLRQQAMLADAQSHMLLPGMVIAFLVVKDTESIALISGALITSMLGSVTIEKLCHLSKLHKGAIMGMVFAGYFAAGVVLLEWFVDSRVHLDVQHVLYGNLQALVSIDILQLFDDFTWLALWHTLPQEVIVLFCYALLLWALYVFFGALTLHASFDPQYMAFNGLSITTLDFLIAALTTIAAVVSFHVVGLILVLAMFIGPAAAARLLAVSFNRQVGLSLLFASLAVVGGYGLAALPSFFSTTAHSLSAAGMIGICAILPLLTIIFYRICHRKILKFAKI